MPRNLKFYMSIPTLFLAIAEVGTFAVILYIALALPSVGGGLHSDRWSLTVALIAAAFGLTMWLLGAYDRWHLKNFRRNSRRILVAFVIICPVLLLIAARHPGIASSERAALLLGVMAVSVAFAGIVLLRAGFWRLTVAKDARRKILVLGVGARAARIEELMRGDRELGFSIVGFVRAMNERSELKVAKLAFSDKPIPELGHELGANEVVVAVSDRRGLPVEPLLECRLQGIRVSDYLTFCERETGRVMLDALDPSWLIYSDGFVRGDVQIRMKRVFDILFSTLFLIFCMPLILAAALAIRLESPGPIFHRQVRVGRNGVEFTMFKFRSMRTDAESSGVPQWAAKRDNRITRVGAIIRRLRIDEIPQVLNVLKGDMSFVGPRPERPFFVEQLSRDIRYYKERHRMQPGITGWAQVNYSYGASREDAKEKLSYDLYYIKNYGIALDLLILVRTIQVVFWPVGVR